MTINAARNVTKLDSISRYELCIGMPQATYALGLHLRDEVKNTLQISLNIAR